MMEQPEPHLSRTEARGGSSNHVTRYVLGISLVGVILAFAVVYFIWA